MNDQRFDCNEVEGSLSLHVGGDLEPAARDAIEAHLAFCARCRASARSASAARDALIAALSQADDRAPDLWAGIRATLVREGSLGSAGDAPRVSTAPGAGARAPSLRRWIGAGIAAAAALVLGLWLVGGEPAVEAPVVVEVPERPLRGSSTPSGPSEAVRADPTATSGSNAQTADAASGGLRRIGVGEAPFSDTAEVYVPELFSPAGRRGANASSPASLEIVRPIH